MFKMNEIENESEDQRLNLLTEIILIFYLMLK